MRGQTLDCYINYLLIVLKKDSGYLHFDLKLANWLKSFQLLKQKTLQANHPVTRTKTTPPAIRTKGVSKTPISPPTPSPRPTHLPPLSPRQWRTWPSLRTYMYPPTFVPHFPYVKLEVFLALWRWPLKLYPSVFLALALLNYIPFLFYHHSSLSLWILSAARSQTWSAWDPREPGALASQRPGYVSGTLWWRHCPSQFRDKETEAPKHLHNQWKVEPESEYWSTNLKTYFFLLSNIL